MASEVPVTDTRFVTVEGLRLRYWRMGRGAPVVVVHGAGGNLGDWTAGPARIIAEGFDVTVFDRPGLGQSDWPEDFASISTQARLIRKATEDLGIQNPIVIGHSYGGAVALAWAQDAPGSIAGLLLISAVSQTWDSGGVGALNTAMTIPAAGAALAWILPRVATRDYVEDRLDSVFAPQTAPENYLTALNPELVLDPGTLRRNAFQVSRLKAQVAAMIPHYPQTLRILPVELLHGTADTIVGISIHSIPFTQQVPHANLTTLPGIGHMPHHVSPGEMLDALDRLTRPGAPSR